MTAELSNLLEKIRDARVLVVGDLMLDEFVEGHIDRISPEAPVPILAVDGRRYMPGGAANVAANISALGGKAVLIGVVGDDSAGIKLTKLLHDDQAITFEPIKSNSASTTHKARYVSGGQHMLRVDREFIAPVPAHFYDRIVGLARNALANCQAMVLSDYGKGVFLDSGLAAHLIQLASGMRVPVLVDTKAMDLTQFSGAEIFKPNMAELEAVSLGLIDEDFGIVEAARNLIDVYEFETVVVTLGRDGALLVTEKEEISLEGSHRTVCDVSGAGDTFMAAMAVARATEHAMDACGHFASLVAGISVGKVGTAVVTPEEVLDAVGQPQFYRVGDPGMANTFAIWRGLNLKIGFTNGVFDMLHVDHTDYLRRCSQKCDRLIVGLNSDASVRRIKGEDRPIVPAEQRAAMLLALTWVDMVVIFDRDTPDYLILDIQPDVLIKDSGYEPDEIAGADQLAKWGGRLEIIERGTRTSTTEIVGKMTVHVPADETKTITPVSIPLKSRADDDKPDIYGQARAWLYDEVMPWWCINAWDKHKGGFWEGFNETPFGIAAIVTDKRIMVAARQTAVFSRWSDREDTPLGVYGWQYLMERAIHVDETMEKGRYFVHSHGNLGTTLYDQAFVLLACAERCKIEERHLGGSPEPIRLARSIVTFLDAKMTAPEGYYSEITAEGVLVQSPRHSDPHMHLLEAFIALHEATGGQEWLDRAEGIVELARKRFIRDGVLYETFDSDWEPTLVDFGRGPPPNSPGHHFEWVWLLLEMRRLTGNEEYGWLATTLYNTALNWIYVKTGGVPYNVQPDGTVTDTRRRLWPQCEALRATHAMAKNWPQDGTIPDLRDKLLTTILRDHAAGPVWHEWLEADGTPIDPGTVPASSLYHLFFCMDYVLADMSERIES